MLAGIVSGLMFRANKVHYMRFLLASWFIIPLLRRVIDFASTYADPSPVLLTAYFATLAGPLLSARKMVSAPLSRTGPFVLATAVIVLGACCGVFTNRLPAVMMGGLNWWSPIAIGWLICVEHESAGEYWQGIRSSLPLLTAATAIYSLLQFVLVFPWDVAWVVNLDSPSMRDTDPFSIRAFGNLNSPGTCAFALAFGCLFGFEMKPLWRVLLLIVGSAALIATQVRAGWMVLALGTFFYLFQRTRDAVTTVLPLCLAALFLLLVGMRTSPQLRASRRPIGNPDERQKRRQCE